MQKNAKNSTKVYSLEAINSNKEKLAKEFSEKCEALEDLLLYCWNNNIQTRGCCAGHHIKKLKPNDDYTKEGHGYITFEFSDLELAKQLCLNITRNEFLADISSRKYDNLLVKQSYLAIQKINQQDLKWFGLTFYFPTTSSPKISNMVFKELKLCLESSFNKTKTPENEMEKFLYYAIKEAYSTSVSDIYIVLNLMDKEFAENDSFKKLNKLYQKADKKILKMT